MHYTLKALLRDDCFNNLSDLYQVSFVFVLERLTAVSTFPPSFPEGSTTASGARQDLRAADLRAGDLRAARQGLLHLARHAGPTWPGLACPGPGCPPIGAPEARPEPLGSAGIAARPDAKGRPPSRGRDAALRRVVASTWPAMTHPSPAPGTLALLDQDPVDLSRPCNLIEIRPSLSMPLAYLGPGLEFLTKKRFPSELTD